MTGRGDPPEGPPEGFPGGGEDEYRSVVFDESFIRAARLQEFSAQERLTDHSPAVRSRRSRVRGGVSRQLVVLVVLIALAFGTAIYMGVRHPYQGAAPGVSIPMRSTVIRLSPPAAVPGATPAELFEHSPAAGFRIGSEGVNPPIAGSTESFSGGQVMAALDTARKYVITSALDQEVLTGGVVHPVRSLLDAGQLAQFDRNIDRPNGDAEAAATGWLVRFDPATTALADRRIRVRGSFDVEQAGPDHLEVTSDHTFVYALRPVDRARAGTDEASLFTVRRELRFRFDREDLRLHHAELLQSRLQAGPVSCGSDQAGHLKPLFAGQKDSGKGPAGTDPYRTGGAGASLCGVLAPEAQPRLPAR
ncbi:SCO2583 family membrane protein [Streptomyces meridianus]|uniref:Uncharacterized protein n=1 Tax=Streptomyces meridianus TaxID=2938945 RepID=A0ABT0X2J1_9ACTN|nr:hypothetical protein [Streptomyces meridianus]MCM2576034.1 hypothetical protein [Streptomyces meridianus]